MSLFPESSVLKAKMQYLEIKECITLNNRNIIIGNSVQSDGYIHIKRKKMHTYKLIGKRCL